MPNWGNFTFGCEHEWGDIPRTKPLPKGFKWDDRDVTIVNSNGIANCPKGKHYHLGGEINTPPTDTIQGQCGILSELLDSYPMAVCNYRSNLHAHIRVPGLRDDLRALKRIAMYNAHWLPIALPIIEPIPTPADWVIANLGGSGLSQDLTTVPGYLGAVRRYKRRKRSHHTVLTPQRTRRMLEAHTVEEFFRAEVPSDARGNPMWHAQARAAVNLRQLRETDTIEFRSCPGTLSSVALQHFFEWCQLYLLCALCPTWGLRPENLNPLVLFDTSMNLPTFAPYNHALEIRYRATCHTGDLKLEQILHNIKEIEEGRFDDAAWEASLKW